MHRWVSFQRGRYAPPGRVAGPGTDCRHGASGHPPRRAGWLPAAKQACKKAGNEREPRAECRNMKRDVKHGNVPTVQGGAHPAPTQTPP